MASQRSSLTTVAHRYELCGWLSGPQLSIRHAHSSSSTSTANNPHNTNIELYMGGWAGTVRGQRSSLTTVALRHVLSGWLVGPRSSPSSPIPPSKCTIAIMVTLIDLEGRDRLQARLSPSCPFLTLPVLALTLPSQVGREGDGILRLGSVLTSISKAKSHLLIPCSSCSHTNFISAGRWGGRLGNQVAIQLENCGAQDPDDLARGGWVGSKGSWSSRPGGWAGMKVTRGLARGGWVGKSGFYPSCGGQYPNWPGGGGHSFFDTPISARRRRSGIARSRCSFRETDDQLTNPQIDRQTEHLGGWAGMFAVISPWEGGRAFEVKHVLIIPETDATRLWGSVPNWPGGGGPATFVFLRHAQCPVDSKRSSVPRNRHAFPFQPKTGHESSSRPSSSDNIHAASYTRDRYSCAPVSASTWSVRGREATARGLPDSLAKPGNEHDDTLDSQPASQKERRPRKTGQVTHFPDSDRASSIIMLKQSLTTYRPLPARFGVNSKKLSTPDLLHPHQKYFANMPDCPRRE
ncbi:hypothetical protein V8F06_004924 [Rhypophila decipiens]